MTKIKPLEDAFTTVEKALGKKDITIDDLKNAKTEGNAELTAAVEMLKTVMGRGLTSVKTWKTQKNKHLAPWLTTSTRITTHVTSLATTPTT